MNNGGHSKGILYLLPTALGEEGAYVMPQYVLKLVASIDYFIVENERSARRYLRRIGYQKPFPPDQMFNIGKHSNPLEFDSILKPIEQGNDMALLSEAGLPGIADPGSQVISLAHYKGIRVKPLVGPSSILLALMASGFNGQQFCFRGYLPIIEKERIRAVKQLETKALTEGSSQVFMEVPHRNMKMLDTLLSVCHPATMLCLATNLTLPNEQVNSRTIEDWRKRKPDLHKQPTIFIISR